MEIEPYNPDIICADRGDSGNYVEELVRYFGEGRVYGVKVNSSPRSTGDFIPKWSEPNWTVTIDKLVQNKRHILDMKSGRIGFYNRMDESLRLYTQHWKNVVIRDEEDEVKKEIYEIITKRGDDHFAQSSVYGAVGMDKLLEPFVSGGSYEFRVDVVQDDLGFDDDGF